MPKYGNSNKIKRDDFESLIQGKIPSIIIKNFYKKNQCAEISQRINLMQKSKFQGTKLDHIGPFLMAHATRKQEYFDSVKKDRKKDREYFQTKQILLQIFLVYFKNYFQNI